MLTQPFKAALALGRAAWDNEQTRPVVRQEFQKVLACRTSVLGAEVFASESGEELVVPHTCKSRACPSCGQRANDQWLRERFADLPDVPYSHVVLTMPDVFWHVFKANRHLLHDLPSLGAHVVERWFRRGYEVTPLIVAIPHTFGKDLKFNCHLHLLVSQGGLRRDGRGWQAVKGINQGGLMRMWRYTIVTFLRTAHRDRLLVSSLSASQFEQMLEAQYAKWWSVDCQDMRSKCSVLRYAGRYVRRPPLAQHKIRSVTPQEVRFVVKDRKRQTQQEYCFTPEALVERLSYHVPDRSRHNVRYFGLLAPRTKARHFKQVFYLLGQRPTPKPPPVSWAWSIRKTFGRNPLLDQTGQPMHWSGRLAPQQNAS